MKWMNWLLNYLRRPTQTDTSMCRRGCSTTKVVGRQTATTRTTTSWSDGEGRLRRMNIISLRWGKLARSVNVCSINTYILSLQLMENCIKQNNGIDIYLEYFEEPDEMTQCDAPQAKSIGKIFCGFPCEIILCCWGLYRDPEQIDGHVRPVADLSFKMDGQE